MLYIVFPIIINGQDSLNNNKKIYILYIYIAMYDSHYILTY